MPYLAGTASTRKRNGIGVKYKHELRIARFHDGLSHRSPGLPGGVRLPRRSRIGSHPPRPTPVYATCSARRPGIVLIPVRAGERYSVSTRGTRNRAAFRVILAY